MYLLRYNTYCFGYRNAENVMTTRFVRVMEQKEDGIVGFCYLRMEPREFKYDAIANPMRIPEDVNNAMWIQAQMLPNVNIPSEWKGV